MSNYAIQETDNREETAQWTRQVERGERRIQQKPGGSCQNGRPYTHQENEEINQISNTSKTKSDTQGKRCERTRQVVRRLSKPSEQIGRIVRLDVGLGG